MRTMRRNIIRASIALIIMFALLLGYFIFDIITMSDNLINSAYNKRLNELRNTTIPGGIYDTNEKILANVSYGERSYVADNELRLATSHLVGDKYGYCPTGAEILYGSVLLNTDENLIEYIKRLMQDKKRTGDDIQLTVDSTLNVKAMEIMGANNGSIIVLNYETGEILCMLSSPQFDPEAIDVSKEHGGTTGEGFINRGIQGQYAPGTLFHIITAGAAIENYDNWQSLKYDCSGELDTGGKTVECRKEHGSLNINQAFRKSCDVTFAQIGMDVGRRNLLNYAESIGFNKKFNFSDIVLYQATIDIKANEKIDGIAYAAIGQHEDVVSPMFMALLTSAIANDGYMMEPHLIKSIDKKEITHDKYGLKIFSKNVVSGLQILMKPESVLDYSSYVDLSELNLYGKDGSTYFTEGENLTPHSWFVGYVNESQHPLVVVVMAEHAGEGQDVAMPFAYEILDYAIGLGY